MADIPYHTHTFDLPDATPEEVAEAIETGKVVTPASLVGVSAHLQDRDNPHEVTAAQVGTLDAAEIAAALALQVSVEAQTLTLTQKVQAQVNIGAMAAQITAKSADYTVTTGDAGAVIAVDAGGDARTITLPAAAAAGTGFKVVVKKSDSSFNSVTIDGDGSETIDGATTKVLRLPRQSASLICDGTGWHVFEEAGTEFYGSNESGTFTRFASGIQDVDVIVVVDLGASATIDINYPASFIASPRPAGTISATNSGTAALEDIHKCSIGSTGTGWRIRNNGTAFSGSQSLHLTAKGRWF